MTRAVVFLAVAMVAASLGLVAQDTSGTQNSTQNNSAQHAVAVANNSSQNADSTPAVSNQQDPAKSAVTRDSSDSKSPRSQVSSDTNNGQLPQTSTILPLLGLIGLGSLVAGFFARQ